MLPWRARYRSVAARRGAQVANADVVYLRYFTTFLLHFSQDTIGRKFICAVQFIKSVTRIVHLQ
jgi:hypothetical protein